MTTNASSANYSRNLWLEVADFDTREDDLGVKGYLDLIGFIPDYLSFLISSPDFVHLHDSFGEDAPLPDDCCSYGGRWHFNPQRNLRPPWTRRLLTKLVACLHDEGIAVYFCVFDQVLGDQFHPEWATKHPEVISFLRTGIRLNSINPLARMKDGALYEDFFNRQIVKVLRDYQFDGFHCADGCNHLRYPLYWSDYSDDLVDQFVHATGVVLPEALNGNLNEDAIHFEKRADWIWRNRRTEWIGFYVQRWTSHMKKQVAAVRSVGGKLIFNTTWTRDPFEAIYRWGIDYRKMAEAGIHEFIVECPGAGNDIGSEGGRIYPDFYFKILANILLTKASLPTARIVALHHTHDVQENYEILRHAPTFLEKEAYTYPNLFYKDREGAISRCLEGFVVCLAAGISRDEWRMMTGNWDNSFTGRPLSVSGATLICSERALENQMKDVMETRNTTTHHLLYRLLAKGAPIHSTADIGSIGKLSGPLVVLNSHHHPEAEIAEVLAYKNGPVVLIGAGKPPATVPTWQFKDGIAREAIGASAFHFEPGNVEFDRNSIDHGDEDQAEVDPWNVEEPRTYCLDLSARKISDPFLRCCASLISKSTGTFIETNQETIQTFSTELETGQTRVFVKNNCWSYSEIAIEMRKPIIATKLVTRFPYRPLKCENSRFGVKVPPKGVVCIDVQT